MPKRKQPVEDTGKLKDLAGWTTGDELMTGAQESYLHTLARDTAAEVPGRSTKAEASEKIEELREESGRVGREPGG